MLRKITIGCAVVLAMLAAPVTLSARMGGMGSMGGMHSTGVMGVPHNIGMAGRWGGVHSWHHIVHFDHFHRFHHFRHHFPIFATAIGIGFSSCWKWVPTRWGWHRVWICGW